MKILLTGHTGFKGAWFSILLRELGHTVYGLSLPPRETDYLYKHWGSRCIKAELLSDLGDNQGVSSFLCKSDPDIIVHMASQAFVRHAYEFPHTTYKTNVIAAHDFLMSCLNASSVKKVVVVTSDKVYANNSKGKNFTESDPLGGADPYSASKACQEIVARSWWESFGKSRGISMITARAGNVIGGGDYGEGRIMPDIIYSIYRDRSLLLRSPNSIRPWQYIFDVLPAYYKMIVANIESPFDSFNIGPLSAAPINVMELVKLVEIAADRHGDLKIPISSRRVNSDLKEAEELRIDSTKAIEELNWTPRYEIDESVHESVALYSKMERGIWDSTPFQMIGRCIERHSL